MPIDGLYLLAAIGAWRVARLIYKAVGDLLYWKSSFDHAGQRYGDWREER